MGHDSVVEVDATQPLQPDRLAERLEARGRATEHGGVERATAEVVHGDDLADGHPRTGCVVDGRGDRLGDQRDVAETARIGGLAQQVDLELTPVRRVRQRHGGRRTAVAFADGSEDISQQRGHEVDGRQRRPAEEDRRRVAEAALELPVVRPGSERLRRTAASPVISVPSARRCTTLGITWLCVPNATISAEPSRHTAAAV